MEYNCYTIKEIRALKPKAIVKQGGSKIVILADSLKLTLDLADLQVHRDGELVGMTTHGTLRVLRKEATNA